MSFKDEMYSSLKTPEQVAQEKESAEVQAAETQGDGSIETQ